MSRQQNCVPGSRHHRPANSKRPPPLTATAAAAASGTAPKGRGGCSTEQERRCGCHVLVLLLRVAGASSGLAAASSSRETGSDSRTDVGALVLLWRTVSGRRKCGCGFQLKVVEDLQGRPVHGSFRRQQCRGSGHPICRPRLQQGDH